LDFRALSFTLRAMINARIVFTTAGTHDEAARIARALVERRLAACVNIVGPIESIYRWRDAIETSPEFLLLVKTTDAQANAVRDIIKELHSYELPECIEVSIDAGSPEYLAWLREAIIDS
jgi:periplasmic divalent cation tolerance protein